MPSGTFKETISNGQQFYFKQRDENGHIYYLIEGYKNKIKPFRMVVKENYQEEDAYKWQIAADATVPRDIKALEQDFSDLIEGGE